MSEEKDEQIIKQISRDKMTPEQRQAFDTREYYRHKAFILMLETLFIIGIPAALAAIGGTALDKKYNTGHSITIALLVLAFIISWAVIILKYKNFNKKLNKSEQDYLSIKRKQKEKEETKQDKEN